jgi:hypothetical protein
LRQKSPRYQPAQSGKMPSLIFSTLALQALNFLTLAVQLGLITVDLLLLAVVGVLSALQLVTDQSASAQSESATDRRAGGGVTHCGTDNAARGGAAKGADTGAFFPCAQRPA